MSKTLTISDETFELIKDQLKDEEKVNVDEMKDFIGKKVFIRTVTYHLIGKVEKFVGDLMILSKASWVADSGRFNEAIRNGFGSNAEIEYVGDWFVNLKAITDGGFWKHDLPTKTQ